MVNKEYILNVLKNRKTFLKEHFGVERIALFGSYARNEQTNESDIDLFVDMPASFHNICALEEYLENQFQRKVEIIRNHANLRERFVKAMERDSISV